MVDLNVLVVISLGILAVVSLCLIVVLIPIASQLIRTLNSAQHLLDIVNDDLEPTVKEIKDSVSTVREFVKTGSSKIRTELDKLQVVLGSSVYGLYCGVKEYVTSYKTDETSYNDNGRSNFDKSENE